MLRTHISRIVCLILAIAFTSLSLGQEWLNEYDPNKEWYGLQVGIEGKGYKVQLYINGELIKPIFMDGDKRSETVWQLQNSDAPNKKVAEGDLKSLFVLNRGRNEIKVVYKLLDDLENSKFEVVGNAGRMYEFPSVEVINIGSDSTILEGEIIDSFMLSAELFE